MWMAYKVSEGCFWIAEDIDLSQDRLDTNDIAQYHNEYKFVSRMLVFLLVMTGTLMVKMPSCFSSEIQSAEARAFYGLQSAMYVFLCVTYSTNLTVLQAEHPH